MHSDTKPDSKVMRILEDIWVNSFLGLKVTLYIIVILFFIIGIYVVCNDGVFLGIVLIIVSVLLFLLFRKLDKKNDEKFDQDFEEMIQRNRNE